MFGPSGDRTGSILEYCEALMSRIENDARSRVTPPVPMTDNRRKLSTSDKGLVWSRMVDKRLRRKNSLMVATNGRALTSEDGVKTSSVLVKDIFSRIDRSNLSRPMRNAEDATNSPTDLTRRLLR